MKDLKLEDNQEKKVEDKKEEEVGPIMGLFAVSPKIEC
jgi:hypothetical protein